MTTGFTPADDFLEKRLNFDDISLDINFSFVASSSVLIIVASINVHNVCSCSVGKSAAKCCAMP